MPPTYDLMAKVMRVTITYNARRWGLQRSVDGPYGAEMRSEIPGDIVRLRDGLGNCGLLSSVQLAAPPPAWCDPRPDIIEPYAAFAFCAFND
jgi:hypothetical protein